MYTKKMTTKGIITIVAMAAMVAGCGTRCYWEEGIVAYERGYTPCKSHIDVELKGIDAPDSAEVRCENGVIYVTHYNLMVNCAFEADGIAVRVEQVGNRLIVHEYSAGGDLANCVCEADNTFEIHGLAAGNYILEFPNWYDGNGHSTHQVEVSL